MSDIKYTGEANMVGESINMADKKDKEDKPKEPEIRFPALDNAGSHFYDNEAGVFWVGLNLKSDPLVLPLILDAAKLPMVQAMIDFKTKEQRKFSLLNSVKNVAGNAQESLERMFGRLASKKEKSIIS